MNALETYREAQSKSVEDLIAWSDRPVFCKRCGELTEETVDGYRQIRSCQCKRDAHLKRQQEDSGTPKSAYDRLTFTSYYAKTQAQKRVKETCETFSRVGRGKWIALLGTPGTGKTHLATATLKVFQETGGASIYAPYQNLVGEIKNARVNRLDAQAMLNRYKNINVLLIDDIFKGGATSADRAIINEVLDHRYTSRLTTIITSNLNLAQLFELDEALAGRIVEMTEGTRILECDWDDHRLGLGGSR